MTSTRSTQTIRSTQTTSFRMSNGSDDSDEEVDIGSTGAGDLRTKYWGDSPKTVFGTWMGIYHATYCMLATFNLLIDC